MNFFRWWHHLKDPHCHECAEEREEEKICQSCETLKVQLSIANHEKQELLNSLLSLTKKPEEQTSTAVDYEKVKPKMMTWNVRRQMLEAEDKKAAQILAEQKNKKSIGDQIADLEKEMGIEEVNPDA